MINPGEGLIIITMMMIIIIEISNIITIKIRKTELRQNMSDLDVL